MNYLAHLFLARRTPEFMIGGLLGDFVKGRLDHRYPSGVRAGIELHRAIDRYTDAHPLVHAGRALIAPTCRRFAGILVDVFYDHFLALRWQRYSEIPLPCFTRQVYALLWPRRRDFPAPLQRILPWMRAEDWLANYAGIESVDAALRGMARRFRFAQRAQPLADGVRELIAHYGALEAQFHEFFPQLQQFVVSWSGVDADEAWPQTTATG